MQSVRGNMSLGARPRGMSRFDSSFQDFLYDNGLHYYTTQFYQELNVHSIQDLALLSDDELRQVLPPTEMTTFRDALRKAGVKRIPPDELIGRWIDVEGFGPGRVVHYHKVSNRFMFDSKHSVDFRGPEFKVLLRRRKFMRWNGGARYIVLDGEPSKMDSVKAVENEHEVMSETINEGGEGGDSQLPQYEDTTIASTHDGSHDNGEGNEVDDSWEACIDPNTGDTYYYNLVTLETSWILPEKRQPSFAAPPAAPAAPTPPPKPSSELPPMPTGQVETPPSSDAVQAVDAPKATSEVPRARPQSVKLLARPPSLRAMPKLPGQPKPAILDAYLPSPVEENTKEQTHDAAKDRHLDKTLRTYKAINPKNLGKSPRGRSNSPSRPASTSAAPAPSSSSMTSAMKDDIKKENGQAGQAGRGHGLSAFNTKGSGSSSNVLIQHGDQRIALICDLDGTMLPGPKKVNGEVVHPSITEGATYAPLLEFLNDGGSVFGVTGGTLKLQQGRFWDSLPLKARQEGRVILFCETGMVMYRSKQQMDTLYPGWEKEVKKDEQPPPPPTPPPPQAKEEEAAASGECERYQIDMTAAAFGQCKCGLPKASHSDAALKGGKPKPTPKPVVAAVAAPPKPTPYSGDGGEPIEDVNYGPFEGNTQRYLSDNIVNEVSTAMRKGLRNFFSDLKTDSSLLEDDHWLHELAMKWADEDAPLTQDPTVTPRIECRKHSNGKTFGMIIVGVPTQYGEKYLTSTISHLSKDVHGQPTGRLSFDVTVPGLGKHLVLEYLIREKLVTAGATLAMADSPSGNDKGLTSKHNEGIPFVSVYGGSHASASQSKAILEKGLSISENNLTSEVDTNTSSDDYNSSPAAKVMNEELTQILDRKVQAHLVPCHVGGNEVGSAAVISRLIPLNRQGLPTIVGGKESWLDVSRVEQQVVSYAREDLIDL